MPKASEDELIVSGIRAGNEEAFEELYAQYYPRLYSYTVLQTRSKDLAGEIVHDVFLNIWRRHTTFTLSTTLASYLYVSVRNRALNARKISARDADISMSNPEDYAASVPINPSDEIENKDLIERVWLEVATLPDNRREALTLSWRHGLKPEEIASVMGISTASVKMHISRGMQALRKRLVRIG